MSGRALFVLASIGGSQDGGSPSNGVTYRRPPQPQGSRTNLRGPEQDARTQTRLGDICPHSIMAFLDTPPPIHTYPIPPDPACRRGNPSAAQPIATIPPIAPIRSSTRPAHARPIKTPDATRQDASRQSQSTHGEAPGDQVDKKARPQTPTKLTSPTLACRPASLTAKLTGKPPQDISRRKITPS